MRTPIEILVKAMHILANDIQSDDGVANSAIYEAAQRLEEQNQRIKRLEEQLMESKNKYAVLVADVVLNEDRAERIKQLEEENDAMRADLLLWREQEVKP